MASRAVVITLAGAICLAAACSGGGGGEQAEFVSRDRPRAPTGSAPAPSPVSAGVPAAVVKDLADGADVNLQSLFPADRPTLVWFWAPNCLTCARGVPDLAQFAQAHAADLSVVGLGTQDTYAGAEEFVSRYGVTFRMLWDSGYASWEGFGVQRQPAHVLLAPDGARVKSWQGELDEAGRDEVIRLALGAAPAPTPVR